MVAARCTPGHGWRPSRQHPETSRAKRKQNRRALLGAKAGGRIPGAGEKQNPSQKISVQTGAPARAETEVGKCFGLAALSVRRTRPQAKKNEDFDAAWQDQRPKLMQKISRSQLI
jgi:hypothetical protein